MITQSSTNADSKARISAAKTDLAELFENIDTVRARAHRTENAITAMTADIKKLDSTKRNLTLSMTMLKRLQMLSMFPTCCHEAPANVCGSNGVRAA